jgi:hypothetical protein
MSSEDLPRVGFYLWIVGGDFDPAEVTSRLGVEPTKVWRAGDPITEGGRGRRVRPSWLLGIEKRETLKVDELIEELRARLDVPPATVKQVCDDLGVKATLVCGVGMGSSETTPALVFPPDFLEWVGEMGATLDVDVLL